MFTELSLPVLVSATCAEATNTAMDNDASDAHAIRLTGMPGIFTRQRHATDGNLISRL